MFLSSFFYALMRPQKPAVCGVCEIRCFIYDVSTLTTAKRFFIKIKKNRYFWIDLVQNKKRLFQALFFIPNLAPYIHHHKKTSPCGKFFYGKIIILIVKMVSKAKNIKNNIANIFFGDSIKKKSLLKNKEFVTRATTKG